MESRLLESLTLIFNGKAQDFLGMYVLKVRKFLATVFPFLNGRFEGVVS